MSINRTASRDDRISSVFLRAIGCLALADHELQQLRSSADGAAGSWLEFADHLAEGADAVMQGACGSSFAGNSIAILRQGVRVPVDLDYIERLTDKMHRHIRVGRALGIGDVAQSDTLVASA